MVARRSGEAIRTPYPNIPVVVVGQAALRRIVRSARPSILIYDDLAIDLDQVTCALYFMAKVQKRRKSAQKFRTIKSSSQLKGPF
jgi:hypothetical protein